MKLIPSFPTRKSVSSTICTAKEVFEDLEAEVEASEGSILVDSEMEECKSIWATSEILLEA